MASIRTHNNRKLREQRRRRRRNRLINSPSVKRWLARATQAIATSMGAPGRPWFKLKVSR